ncbi:MAG: nucleotidyltransferase domain-containing protein [Nitrososphaerota archaeon]
MIEELQEYVSRVMRAVKLHAAILFGSRARGDHGPWSDYDILLIGDFHDPYLKRLKMLFELTEGLRIPVEPHPYTLDEALEMLERGNPIIVDAMEGGRMLYANDVFKVLLAKYHEMKRAGKLKRTKTSITF